jgi:hypothetical protein
MRENGVSGLTDLTTDGIGINYVIQQPDRVGNERPKLQRKDI